MNPSKIVEMASSFYESCVLFTAADLGVFRKLAELKQASLTTLASACELNPRGAKLLLDACVAIGLLTKTGDLYSNTPETALFLVPGSPADLSTAIRYNRDVYQAWGRLAELVKSGNPVERPEIHLGENQDRTRTFVLSMHGRALGIGRAVIPLLNLKSSKKLFDVGGGPGTYATLIAQANPDIQCTVLDLPEVVQIADELIRSAGLQNRVHTLAGDYHTTPFPPDNDAIIFFGMLHQETPASIINLLQRAHESLRPGGIVYVLDMMTDPSHTQPKFSALFAVNMALTTHNGWVFSDSELAGWLAEAGFTDFACRPLPAPMPHWLASARKE